MRRDDLVYLRHMLDQAELAVSKLSHKTRAEYDADDTLRLALSHLVQTFGEAAGRVSPAFRARCSDVPWERVIGMRHRIVHDYHRGGLRHRLGCREVAPARTDHGAEDACHPRGRTIGCPPAFADPALAGVGYLSHGGWVEASRRASAAGGPE